jgi:hypothetical protein
MRNIGMLDIPSSDAGCVMRDARHDHMLLAEKGLIVPRISHLASRI